jgi:integrase
VAKRVHQLTEAAVEKAKPAAGRREIPDGNGLYLVVQPSGQKSWAVRYRRDGKPRKLTLTGTYPSIDLKTARSLAKSALREVAAGADPAANKLHARHEAADESSLFPNLAGEFLGRYLTRAKQRPKPRTLEELGRLLGMVQKGKSWEAKKGGLADRWRAKKVADITKGDIIDRLDARVEAGTGITANRVRGALHQFLEWCLRRGIILSNPCATIDRPVAERARERVLTDGELALFWRASLEDRLFGPMWRLLALTGQRRDEARGMTWAELDIDSAEWTIPASRTKNKREHLVPLPAPAVALLRKQPRISGKSGFVFTTTGKGMLGGLSRAKGRLDARMTKLGQRTIEPWRVHDLRRTCASGLQRLGISLPVIEKVLNHTSGSFAGVVGVYQRHDFAAEKRAALDAWARHVEAVATDSSNNVIEMKRRRTN